MSIVIRIGAAAVLAANAWGILWVLHIVSLEDIQFALVSLIAIWVACFLILKTGFWNQRQRYNKV